MGYKLESKDSVPLYHRILCDYGTNSKSKSGVNIAREGIPSVDLDEINMTKTSKKSKKVIKKVSKEVIPNECLIHPRNFYRYWISEFLRV